MASPGSRVFPTRWYFWSFDYANHEERFGGKIASLADGIGVVAAESRAGRARSVDQTRPMDVIYSGLPTPAPISGGSHLTK